MPMNRTSATKGRNAGLCWVLAGVVFLLLGLSSEVARHYGVAGFWTSYVLDFAGPAWSYLGLRALATTHQQSGFWRRFEPGITATLIIGSCFAIEGLQYLEVYEAHFDPYDLIAYSSGVLALAAIDRWTGRRRPAR
jgi:hypothetical protein